MWEKWEPRRGIVVWYSVILMAVMIFFVSLMVDYGRVQLAKTELQVAADAAARYGAIGLAIDKNTAISNANTAAYDNKVDRVSQVLANGDVLTGNWDSSKTPAFSTTRTPTNAVQVTAR